MKDRTLSIIVVGAAIAVLLAAMFFGCRAMRNNPSLWLFAAAGVQSPRGAETFAAPTISVTIRWDHSGADGFRVYLRKGGVPYSTYQDAGTNKVFRFSGLQRKTTYKVVVTAYDDGIESVRSEELSFRTGNNAGDPPEEL